MTTPILSPRLIQHYPAAHWKDAFLLGDGSLGAMLHGRIAAERITLNHERLWGSGSTLPLPDIHAHLPQLRELLDHGEFAQAEALYRDLLQAEGYQGTAVSAFMPGADLEIVMRCDDGFSRYRRELDLHNGIASVSWEEKSQTTRREAMVHSQRGYLYFHPGALQPRQAIIRLAPHDLLDRFTQHLELLSLTPEVVCYCFEQGLGITVDLGNGCRYAAVVQIRDAESLQITDTQASVTLGPESHLLALIAPLDGPGSATPAQLYDRLSAETDRPEALRSTHIAGHRERMGALSFHLGQGTDERSNEALLEEAYSGTLPEELICRMFHYGRYLLVCSSQPGGLPAHLQGGWNGDYVPPWRSAFFNNENLQMTYWQALPGGVPETLLPVFDLYESRLDDFRTNARHLFGTRGIVLPLYMSPECGLTKDLQSHVIYWTGAAAWLAQLYWEYWLFSRDHDFLRHRAIPFMREAAQFYEDFLVTNSNGATVIYPGNSPENRALPHRTAICINATMDFALVRELLGNLLHAHEVLGLEEAATSSWNAILQRLPEYEVAPTGALREWLHPEFGENDHHRHISHIYPFFPGHEIPRDPTHPLFVAVAEAVRRRLTIGLGEQTGWSLVHLANIFGRLGDGEAALSSLVCLAQSCTGSALLTYHNDTRGMGMTMPMYYGLGAPLQLDANFGYPAAVMEMLLYSSASALHLLPALPEAWRRGAISGLHTRCGVIVEIVWDRDAGNCTARIKAKRDTCFTLRLPSAFGADAPQSISLRAGEIQTF